MGQRALRSKTGIVALAVALLAGLALPAVGAATVVQQITDEEPRKLTAADVANLEAQFGTRTAASSGPSAIFDPFEAAGVMVAHGANTQPTGSLRLVTYVLEEVTLPAGVSVPVLGDRAPAGTVLRLTVTGGPFVARAMPPIIWIDDVPLRVTAISPDLTRISALVTDPAALKPGASIALSYDELPETRQRLPETLSLGPGVR